MSNEMYQNVFIALRLHSSLWRPF